MKKFLSSQKIGRRQFLKAAGAAVVLPAILPSSVLGRDGKTPPSGKINIGVVGWGMQGPENTQAFLAEEDCRVIAACDVDKNHLADAVQTINGAYGNKDCASYHDYREMMARPDLDAVMLAVPDHWHALVAIEAANRKLDVYGEKPLAKTLAEQQAIVRAVEANNIIWQTGSWQRSEPTFHKAAEIVRNGLIGDVTRVEVGLLGGFFDHANVAPELLDRLAKLPGHYDDLTMVRPGTDAWKIAVTPPPPELDYDTWIGPSTMVPYIKQRSHMAWRWNYNTGGGMLMDWVGHHLDIAHWGLDCDTSGPSVIEGKGEFPPADALWNTCTRFRIEMKYPRNVDVIVAGGYDEIQEGTKWIGPQGWVWVNRGGFDASNPEWVRGKSLPENLRKVKLYESPGHERNFLDCVKSRKPTITPVQTAHHSTSPGHLGLIAMRTGRKIRWDVKTETIQDDAEATAMLSRPYRAPWHLA